MRYPVDRLIPSLYALHCGMALLECCCVLLKITAQLRILVESHEAIFVPGVHKIMPRPFHSACANIVHKRQFEQARGFHQARVFGNKNAIIAGRHTNADLRMRF